MAKIAVLGCGFGTSLAVMANKYGHDVVIWSKFEKEIQEIRTYGENRRLLPGVPVSPSIVLTTNLADIEQAEYVLMVVPTNAMREAAKSAAPHIRSDAVVINLAKGLEKGSLKRMSQVLQEEMSGQEIVVLSGPCHAEEVARNMPTTIVAASNHRAAAERVQDVLSNGSMRIYVSDDMIGVEVGGAFKNVIALCAGICDGAGLGDNTKAALMTRGITEIARLGVALGAQTETFAGLSGIGDLIVTCMSMHSRNRRAGILIGQGIDPVVAVERVGTVEGYTATETAWMLAQKQKIEMPITEQLYQVLYQGKFFRDALQDLLSRPQRHENEEVWLNSK